MGLKVTLLGEGQARIGYRFLYENIEGLCVECDVRNVCMGNLESGRVYEVRKVSGKRFPCILHAGPAVLVEVEEPHVEVAIQPRLAIIDAIITYTSSKCSNPTCEHWDKCYPKGLVDGDRCRVVEVKDSLSCPSEGLLLLVSLQRCPQA
ncbi:MAG: UPF0179 family protein [Candidatus Bathyarchaeia archaeon]|nr:UPF0179 family protein [Candidatus Bathyarchaeota archaeon]